MLQKPPVQLALLVGAALVLAVVANGFASRERRLVLPGYYPHALRVPAREADRPPVAAVPAAAPAPATATTPQSSGPGQPPVAIPTATIERPAGGVSPVTKTVAPPTQPAAIQPSTTPARPVNPAPAAPPVDLLARFPPHPDQPYVELGGADVALLHAQGALFLDARRTSVFEAGHIAGARPFSVWESDIDDKVSALFEQRSDPREQNQPIVIYCSGGACEDSHMLAEKLWAVQFNNVYVYKDGFPDWQKRGGAVRTGAQP